MNVNYPATSSTIAIVTADILMAYYLGCNRAANFSQTLLYPSLDALQGPRQLRCVVASGLGHSRSAPALSPHLLRDKIDELAGLELRGEVSRDPGDQAHLSAFGRAEHDRGGFQLALQFVECFAQSLRIGAV